MERRWEAGGRTVHGELVALARLDGALLGLELDACFEVHSRNLTRRGGQIPVVSARSRDRTKRRSGGSERTNLELVRLGLVRSGDDGDAEGKHGGGEREELHGE